MGGKLMVVAAMAAGMAMAQTTSKVGGLAFRYDDNQALAKWKALAEVFDRHGYPMSLALIATKDDVYNAETLAFLKEAAAKGHELMDHTPNHSVFSFMSPEPQKYANEPWVDHIDGNRICAKYRLREDMPPSIPRLAFKAKVKGATIELPEEVRKRYWPNSQHVIFNGKAYIVKGKSEHEFTLESFWREPVDLGDLGEVECQYANKAFGFYAEPEQLKAMARQVREHRRKLGLPMPTAWIQPGSPEAIVQADNIRAGYAEFGYVSGATYQNSAALVYCEPNPERCAFAMMWGQINLERTPTLDELKKSVADAVATHRVLIASSHIRTDKFPDGLSGFVALHDQLLSWCKEKGVMVKTQSEWARLLYGSKTDPRENILPPLSVDLNGDGIPDGYELGGGAAYSNGSLSCKGKGLLCRTLKLGGVERGRNTLKLEIQGGAPRICIHQWNYWKAFHSDTAKGNECSFEVLPDTVTIVIELFNDGDGAMTVTGGSLSQN